MKTKLFLLALATAFGLQPSALLHADTTINATNRHAYGANLGWIDWRGDTNNGAVIGEYVCSGNIYSGNAGWISLGSGAPANGIRYQNAAATDFGVNHDDLGNLRGYAYGANIGWINFEATGAPKVNLATGRLSGYAYSANCGWISLSNATAFVQTDTLAPGADTDSDGMADAWELGYTNTLAAFSAASDTDGDGQPDAQEAVADTNPLDPNDNLRITSFLRGHGGDPSRVDLVWTGKPTRFYRVEQRAAFDAVTPWAQLPLGFESWPGWNNVGFNNADPQNFYRIQAVKPLSP